MTGLIQEIIKDWKNKKNKKIRDEIEELKLKKEVERLKREIEEIKNENKNN
jgi:hypothetical protein